MYIWMSLKPVWIVYTVNFRSFQVHRKCNNILNQITQMGHSRLNWSLQEQQLLKKLKLQGILKGWKEIAEELNKTFQDKNRTGKQCRQRYMNYVKFSSEYPKIDSWTHAQDKQLFEKFCLHGPRWVLISNQMPGRSQNSLKNRFYGILRRIMRKIENFSRVKKVKHRKALKLQILVQALQEKNKQNKFDNETSNIGNNHQQFYQKLSNIIIQMGLKKAEETESQEIEQLVQMLYKFIAQKRSETRNKKKINKDQDQQCQLAQRQSTQSVKIEEQEFGSKGEEKKEEIIVEVDCQSERMAIDRINQKIQRVELQDFSFPYGQSKDQFELNNLDFLGQSNNSQHALLFY